MTTQLTKCTLSDCPSCNYCGSLYVYLESRTSMCCVYLSTRRSQNADIVNCDVTWHQNVGRPPNFFRTYTRAKTAQRLFTEVCIQ